MSGISDLLAALRQAVLIEHRVTDLAERLKDLDRRELDTRERLIRVETIIATAQARARRIE
ncbi:hypothetical protein IP88_02275 [alpha proteobacterium AAP81b]|nr:hypothetical protein IP88_02275 [alpha proteobacterium AAP81b]